MNAQQRMFSTSASLAKYYKVTLRRSTIGLPKQDRATAKTLGLYRLNQTTYHPVSPSAAGLILKIKEIVKVENVEAIPEKSNTKADRGYEVIGNVL
ncbi:hypothetical protein BCR43DRAFT_487343 [Syncephalastrum racemosum]|uniref:Large ribosomal subunit protein uL30m n=1 Tax=Syncephalastrum racemosum TaxID=13706 RepID=A0A1X2HQM3_SYNRA|nr:hypothetical protein BCR43DRAFT_487343 [Syncephalastrum racemosum]